jgi:membrane-bound lytic murein transglycosylase
MTNFDKIVEDHLINLDESWKKYATGAALGAAGMLGFQNANDSSTSGHPKIRQIEPTKTTQSAAPSKANTEDTIKSKHNINEYKVGLMARFHQTETTSGNAKSSGNPTYQYEIHKEIGDMYPNYQMVKIYNYGRPVVTIRFSKDGSQITRIIKNQNLHYPEKMQTYIKNQFGITL